MSDESWIDVGWIDVGHDCAIKPYSAGRSAYDEHEDGDTIIGYFFRHPDPTDPSLKATPGWCIGTVPIARESGERGWKIEQVDPLTLSPSILCLGTTCGGIHGYIRNGRWEPC